MTRIHAVVSMMLLAGLTTLAVPAAADYVIQVGQMPDDQFQTATVWTGTYVYSFGGWNGQNSNDQIVRFDPATDTLTLLSSTVPANLQNFAVAWSGTHVYLFGGWDGAGPVSTIRRWDPTTETWTTLSANLPSARQSLAAITAGSDMYLFGGILDAGTTNQIVRFTPATDTVTTMAATIGPARYDFSAVWTGTYGYLFGGTDTFGAHRDTIQRYDPATDTLTLLSTTLPAVRLATSAVWDGAAAYISGGSGGGFVVDTTFKFDPAAGTATTLDARIRTFRTGAAWVDGEGIYMGDTFGRILRFNPVLPQPPSSLFAAPGPGVGQIDLTWTEPPHDDDVTNYRIYRGTDPASVSFVAEVGNALAYLDTGLTPGTTYHYEITSKNAAGEGPPQPVASARATQLPGAPTGLAVTAGPDAGELTLTWTAPADNGGRPVTAYDVYRSSDGSSFAYRASVGAVTTLTDAGLGDGVTRIYKVAANTSAGQGPASTAAAGTTFSLPGAPANVAAEPGPTPDTIRVSWEPPTVTGGSPPLQYHVYRGHESGDLDFVSTVAAPGLSLTDPDRSPLIVYYYQVSAENIVGPGPRSGEVSDSANPWPSRPPGPLPAGWTDEVLLDHTEEITTPPVSLPLLTIDGRPNAANPDLYDVSLTVAGTPLPVVGVNTLGLVTQPVHLELVDGPDPVATVKVLVVARSDPSKKTCLFTVGGECAAAVPTTDPAWLASQGPGALLWIEFHIRDQEGNLLAHNFVTVPVAGQAVP